MKKENKQYQSRRVIINDHVRKKISEIKKSIGYKKFIGEIMNEFGVSERFVRDILVGYEFTNKIKVKKKSDRIERLK